MGVQERRAREKEELRQEIMEAARELFVKEGFDNVSMRKIAEKIEYSPTTIYLYFQDKGDLLDCIVEETLLNLTAKLDSLREGRDPVVDLKTGLRAYIEYWTVHPNDFRVAFMTDLKALDPNRAWRCTAVGAAMYGSLRTRLRECADSEVLEIRDLETAAQAIWAAIYGLVALFIMKPHFPWVDQSTLIDTVVNSAVDSMIPKRVAQLEAVGS
ncbi:MAG TPA: TetR/AcrR family transcriptional regulator [Bryobacteraceae bacterium]|jgi:AcrR family transcriptional regulator